MKTEKEKMSAGEIYQAFDRRLAEERSVAKEVLFEYNRLSPAQTCERRRLLAGFLGAVGERFLIEQPFYCDYGYNIFLGEDFYANVGCTILDGAPVRFGHHVLLGPQVGIYTAGHPLDTARRNEGLEYALPVTIGDEVWIGAQSVVLPGVTIGARTVVGAGSVVTRDIPAGVLAVGNPCRVVREIVPAPHARG